MRYLGLMILSATLGCTNLGPMAGITMSSPTPNEGHRPGAELSAGAVPGFHLSDSVQEEADGTIHQQLAGWFDPGELAGALDGFGVGARWVGAADDAVIEPMLRYRTTLGAEERVSLGVVAYGSHASGTARQASYEMTRAGGEVAVEARLTPANQWAELRLSSGVGLTGLLAEGEFCVNERSGWARDCEEEGDTGARSSRELRMALPSGFVGVAVDGLRELAYLHGVRLAAYLAGGMMPRLRDHPERSEDRRAWGMFGLALQAGIGAR